MLRNWVWPKKRCYGFNKRKFTIHKHILKKDLYDNDRIVVTKVGG